MISREMPKLDKYLKNYYQELNLIWELRSVGIGYKEVILHTVPQLIVTIGITPDGDYYWWNDKELGKYDY